ncbi:MAG: ROK family protein, partial [Bryobacteraceae bacterium]
GYDDIVTITLGTGIGGAAMMQWKLLRGKHYQGGCLGGHLAMNARGRRCNCGAIGCAESEASTWALPLICENWPDFATSRLAQESALNFAALFRLVGEGDRVAMEIMRHCIDVWAALTVSLIHAYDPDVVVIGGGVMRSAEQILPPIRKRVEEAAWTPWGNVLVKQAECGEDAALLGAVPLVEEIRG